MTTMVRLGNLLIMVLFSAPFLVPLESHQSEGGISRNDRSHFIGRIPIDPELPGHLQRRLLGEVRQLQTGGGYHHSSSLARKKRRVWPRRFITCPFKVEWTTKHTGEGYSRNYTLYHEAGYTHEFYEVSCDMERLAINNTGTNCPKCCLGMRNDFFKTECVSLTSWHPVKAFGSVPNSYVWTYILVKSTCFCRADPRVYRGK
ncbi:hypothetical protein RRG08_021154 [Elysia crispata]|uniref:Spaetzle domain-containing protein n=1 Tax=Elysia crispata TaxID=231223 RepID=A0AAE1DBG9_9GAST|nr:hypothetical protein RRG08_021154 [Elysia crispata]